MRSASSRGRVEMNRFAGVAQISNLLYRRFPIGSPANLPARCIIRRFRRLEALRYSRLEICATRFQRICRLAVVAVASLLAAGCVLGATPKHGPEPTLLVVMAPSAKALARTRVK